jgi:hypothetical protein
MLFRILENFRNWFEWIWNYFAKVTKEFEIRKRENSKTKKSKKRARGTNLAPYQFEPRPTWENTETVPSSLLSPAYRRDLLVRVVPFLLTGHSHDPAHDSAPSLILSSEWCPSRAPPQTPSFPLPFAPSSAADSLQATSNQVRRSPTIWPMPTGIPSGREGPRPSFFPYALSS